ncbi:hypothetical protein MTO96_020222 [Rhipicephalus appendiculatus]
MGRSCLLVSACLLVAASTVVRAQRDTDFYFGTRVRCHTCDADFTIEKFSVDHPCLVGQRERDVAYCSVNSNFCKHELLPARRDYGETDFYLFRVCHTSGSCNESFKSRAGFIFYFRFGVFVVLPTLLRLPCVVEDPRLEAFLAPTRLPRWLEDARLRAWRRFLPRFERMLVADDEEVDRAWRRLFLRLFVLRWLLSNRVAELAGLRPLRARPPWRLWDELRDRPRLTFLRALRRWGDSLAASLMVLLEELLERFLRLTLRALFETALMFAGFSLAGCDTSAAFRSLRAAVVATGSGASGSTDTALGGRPRGRLAGGRLVGRASCMVVSCSRLALRLPAGLWRLLVALGLLRHGCVAAGPVPPSAVDPLQPAVVLSVAAPRQGGLQETASVRVREIPHELLPARRAYGETDFYLFWVRHTSGSCNDSFNSRPGFIIYFRFRLFAVLPVLLRLPCLVEDPLLEAFLALTRLPRWLEDARLRAWRRFLPRFERMVVANDEEVDRAWRRLLLRLLVLRWLLSDRVAELAGLRALRARPPWRLRDELRDRPRLTFLRALRRFGGSLAVSMVVVKELLERFLRLTLRALVGTALMFAGFSFAGCDTSAAFRSLRAAVVATGSGASGSTDTALGGRPRGRLAGGASLEGPAPSSAAAAAAAAWRFDCRPAFGGFSSPSAFFVGMAASLRVPSQPSAVDPLQPAVVLSVAAPRQGGLQETASVRVREVPVSATSRAEQLPPTEAAFGSRAPPSLYFLFGVLAALPALLRRPRLDDPRLEAFLALTRLFPRPEDARLRAWRRLLRRFERMLVADDAELDRAWRRLAVRLFLRWLISDRVAELAGLRALRARPPW